MPSPGFGLPDAMQARVGEKVVGIGVLNLHGDTPKFDLSALTAWSATTFSTMELYEAIADHAHSGSVASGLTACRSG